MRLHADEDKTYIHLLEARKTVTVTTYVRVCKMNSGEAGVLDVPDLEGVVFLELKLQSGSVYLRYLE